MSEPTLFQGSDERLDALEFIKSLDQARRALTSVSNERHLEEYRLAVPADWPALPSPAEMALALDVLHRTATCFGHLYNRRLRPYDWPFNFAFLDDPNPTP